MKNTEKLQNDEITQWSREQLSSLGYTLKSNLPENVQNTPWSYVVRFETSDGYIYLKHTPTLLALEAPLLKFCTINFMPLFQKLLLIVEN